MADYFGASIRRREDPRLLKGRGTMSTTLFARHAPLGAGCKTTGGSTACTVSSGAGVPRLSGVGATAAARLARAQAESRRLRAVSGGVVAGLDASGEKLAYVRA